MSDGSPQHPRPPGPGSGAGELAGARVLVTGASSGIGAATAVAFAQAGATVGLCARRVDRLDEVLARCREHAPASQRWAIDLADLDGIADFAARVQDELGGLDVLVNNAGVPKRRLVRDMVPGDVESTMAINYFSPVRLTLAVLPGMLEQDRGHVVNVSSMGVHSAAYRVGAYAASKAAIEAFTEALYLELAGTGVRAHLFVPGTTRTELSTPKEGNDPPFPQDPDLIAEPESVAQALIAGLGAPEHRRFASDREAATAARKEADPNAWLADMARRLAGVGGG